MNIIYRVRGKEDYFYGFLNGGLTASFTRDIKKAARYETEAEAERVKN